MSYQRNLKQIQEDLRKITGGCAILVGVDQIAQAACPGEIDVKSSTIVSFPSVDDYFLRLMEIGEQQQLLLNPSTTLVDGHEFPGFDPGTTVSEAPPSVDAPQESGPTLEVDPDASCIENNSKGEPCGFSCPENLVVGSDGQLRCPFHEHLDPGLIPEPEPDPAPSVDVDVKLAKLEDRNWLGQKLTSDKTEDYLCKFFERTGWEPATADMVIDWLKANRSFPLDSVKRALQWYIDLERNPEVVARLKELASGRYTPAAASSKMQDGDPTVEKGRLYASLFVADLDLFVYSDDIQRRDELGRDWPLIGQALRLFGLRLLMELPNFDVDKMQLMQIDYILSRLLKQELTIETVVACPDWSALCPPPVHRPQSSSSSARSNPRSKRGGGRRGSQPRSDASAAEAATSSTPPATAQPAPAEPVTHNEPEGDPVKEIEEAIARLCKAMAAAPPTELHLSNGDVFVELCVETWGDGTNDNDIREAAQAALDSLEEA